MSETESTVENASGEQKVDSSIGFGSAESIPFGLVGSTYKDIQGGIPKVNFIVSSFVYRYSSV